MDYLDLKQKKPRVALDGQRAMELWKQGKTDKEISEGCNVSAVTVKNWRHRNHLFINRADGTRADCYPKKKKQRVLTPLERDAKAAREAGLTYGQYKAQQKAQYRESLWERVRKQTHEDSL